MTGHGTAGGKHHAPRAIGDAAPQLAIDEIADAPKKQSRRNQRGDKIHHFPEQPFPLPRPIPDRDKNTEQPAMKGHATVPDPENVERIGQKGF